MNLLDISKLDKLTIVPYKDEKLDESKKIESYVSLDTFTQDYGIVYTKNIKKRSIPSSEFAKYKPRKLQFKLILDNTLVFNADLGEKATIKSKKTILEQTKGFLAVCYDYQEPVHSPNSLQVTWGETSFDCKLEKANIKYSLFDKGGIPLRAEINVTFVEHVIEIPDPKEPGKKGAEDKANESPDITHTHFVKAGDTLPMIAKKTYGNASYYLLVAKANNLNHFRELKAGTELKLPSIQLLEQYK